MARRYVNATVKEDLIRASATPFAAPSWHRAEIDEREQEQGSPTDNDLELVCGCRMTASSNHTTLYRVEP